MPRPVWAGGERRIIAVLRDFPVDRDHIEQLKESNDHYLALSETITEAIFRLDEDFNIIFVNPGVKNTFGFEREELVKTQILRALPGGSLREVQERVQEVFPRRRSR